ncbi:metallophosphoesterase [Comamonas sp. MYb21]|uniref:metallophosphoesterase n=1 Tax=Comamonas sp. MYb21 TaxID=1848648 RepID=UPI003096B39A
MNNIPRFLHITDAHLKPDGSEFKLDDRKSSIPLERQTRELAISKTLERLAENLKKKSQNLDGVIFSGDAMSAGIKGGDKILLDLICEQLRPFGIRPSNIVAIPGNHDIQRSVAPSSNERYSNFIEVWRDRGCITPWLDGIDEEFNYSKHILLAPDKSWAVIAMNSCNWSHVDAISEELKALWPSIPALLAPDDNELQKELQKELSRIERYDMARVSPDQLAALRRMLGDIPAPTNGKQIRIMTLHHHLLAPSLVEEVKPFSDLSNLQQVRTFIAEQCINVVLHGHKHVGKAYSDIIELDINSAPHRSLIISGASFDGLHHSDAMRILELDGLPWSPALKVVPVAVPRGGINGAVSVPDTYRLWPTIDAPKEAPLVIQGKDFNEVYARVKIAAEKEANDKTLIVQLDLEDFSSVEKLPDDYPLLTQMSEEKRKEWLKQLVDWWQLPQSLLQERVPYIHGTRLHKYSSNLDQIERVRSLLKKGSTTRAIAILIDPTLDFKETSDSRNDFASFCLVQFARRETLGKVYIDCIGYYRAQEMVKWWPINVAELLELQKRVGSSFNGQPGRITTITACARALARSPTHVAMPAIDRWLDQTPEKYFVLASAFLKNKAFSLNERDVFNEWMTALHDLLETLKSTGDGGPVVAIEGPRRLSIYLKAGSGDRLPQCIELAETLEAIADKGEEIPKPNIGKKWSDVMSKLLEKAIKQCNLLEVSGETST